MECTLRELADLVGGEVAGEPSTRIRGVAGIREAQPGDITFLSNHRYAPLLNSTHASAVVVGDNKKKIPIPAITVRNADWAFAKIAQHFQSEEDAVVPGIHPTAVVSESARIGKDVSIGALCFVGENAEIGEGTVLHPQVYIGRSVRIGAQCLLYPQVVVRERCLVGSRVILHSGCVVGADGFGFVTLEGRHEKIPQVGIVIVEDDVEIGSNVTIDRARFDKTVIGRGTKIDNLVQIAHNVTLGAHNLVAAQVGIAGSTRLGQYVAVGAQAGIVGHLEIGDGTMIGAQSGVTKGTPPGSVISGGLKAMDHQQHLRQVIASEKLPTLLRDFRKLRERVKQLERELEKQKKA